VLGLATRGTTNPNRLRRVDRWIVGTQSARLRDAVRPVVVDLGYGHSPVTTVELAQRLSAVRADVEILGLEIDPARVAAAQSYADPPWLRFATGGFELAGHRPVLVRALNILRQYDEVAAADAWVVMSAGLAPGGLLIEGTSDELGRKACWVAADPSGPLTLTLSARAGSLRRPSELAERLPKSLIHRNVPGEPVHRFLTAFDGAWAAKRPTAPSDPGSGGPQRWRSCSTRAGPSSGAARAGGWARSASAGRLSREHVVSSSAAGTAFSPHRRTQIERWLVRRGAPHVILDYSATRDVLTRAAPLLTLVFLAELTSGPSLRFTWWQNALAFLGAAAVALAGLAAVNRLRKRRTLQIPDRFGGAEVAAFLLVPPLIPLVIGRQVAQSITLLVVNLVILVLVYFGTSYAVVPMALWSLHVIAAQLRNVSIVVARTMPVLLLFSIFMFLNAEMWKVAAEIPAPYFLGVVALFVSLGSALLILRLPQDVVALERFESWASVREVCADTPAVDAVPADSEPLTEPVPLRRTEQVNIALMLFVSQGLQALLVSLVVTVFYTLLGLLTVGGPTFAQWVGRDAVPLGPTLSVFGGQLALTRELLITAAFIGTVGGLQFLVTAVTDSSYRDQFFGEVRRELREIFAVRKVYLAGLTSRPSAERRRTPPDRTARSEPPAPAPGEPPAEADRSAPAVCSRSASPQEPPARS